MILERDQINRYLRNIIIPEVSGAGQKKLLESIVRIYSSKVSETAALIYYLAAMGVGRICCCYIDETGHEKLFNDIKDLNPEVNISLSGSGSSGGLAGKIREQDITADILLCKCEDLIDNFKNYSFSRHEDEIAGAPLIVGVSQGWECVIKTYESPGILDIIIKDMNYINTVGLEKEDIIGLQLSLSLAGALTAMEYAKAGLRVGTMLSEAIHIDLLSMEFIRGNYISKLTGTRDTDKGYFSKDVEENRQSSYEAKKLAESRVLIVGAGGLGSPAAFALATLGVGTLGFVDFDNVEISNLNRQFLHSTSRLGISKVESTEQFIKALRPDIKVVTCKNSLNAQNALDIIKNYDIVMDCVDNFAARYLLNDACYFAGKPLVDAAAVKFSGLIMTILPEKGPCYRCLFPETAGGRAGMSCSEAGVLGPVPGAMGFIQSAEAVKLLLNKGTTLHNRIIYYDALDTDFDSIEIKKSEKCELCGAEPKITELKEPEKFCEKDRI